VPLQGVHRRPLPLLQPSAFFPTIRTPERGVHAPASAPPSLAHVGFSSPPIYSRWILGDFVVHLMVRGPLVRVRGIHALLTATPNTGSRPVLF
jgi:hypothetical protein